ncbi:ATP-binding protein [Chthonobacter albigriseus]|uniref:ATP-binding protein n=1 Tax=Chthonobacter albigriseus TaxID=1683161 RepID=UPI0015EF420E|nr:ATP-binding protein [Chthonobacter albigriseus]
MSERPALFRRLLPTSLPGQLIAVIVLAIVVAQVLTVIYLGLSRRDAVEEAAREQILARTAGLVRLVDDVPTELAERVVEAATSARTVYAIEPEPSVPQISGAENEMITAAAIEEAFGPGREVRAEMRGRPLRMRDRDGERASRRDRDDEDRSERRTRLMLPAVAVSAKLKDGRWLNAETILPRPALLAWPTLVSTLAMSLATAAAVFWSVRRITRPLRGLAGAADRLGRGEAVDPLPETGPEEVRRTIHAFNAMQARVKRFVSDRTRMVAAISHDMRTPLTSLRLRAEFVDDAEIRDKMIETIEEMNRMSEATLAFARDDARDEASHATDLSALVQAVADDFTDIGNDVSVTGPDKLDLVVRPVALRRALRNLVENAIRYGARARVLLAEGADEVTIRVDDDGPGIPADKLEEVFEPFVRLEGSRSQETGGVGLGLSTARSIVRGHGGDLTLANRPGGGLSATIRLPRASR